MKFNWKSKLKPKQIMLIVMSALLVTVIILTCVVISMVSNLFQSTVDPGDTSAPTDITEPSIDPTAESTDPTAESTDPTTESTDTPTVPAHEHTFVKTETFKPTCSSKGYTIYTCTQCQLTNMGDFMDPKGHEFGEPEVFELTCEQDGYTLLTCLRCGATEERDKEYAPGHNHQYTQTLRVSCITDGYDEYVCANCGDVKKENVIPATGHDFSGWGPVSNDPTKEKRTCVNCLKIEMRDLAVEQDWEGNKFTVDDVDSKSWTHHIVMITLKSTNTSVKYDIYIGLENRDITYTYGPEGLTVTYLHIGEAKTCTLSAGVPGTMTVYSDGTVADYAPDQGQTSTEPSEPSDPIDPTEPTEATDPTESTDPTDATENSGI